LIGQAEIRIGDPFKVVMRENAKRNCYTSAYIFQHPEQVSVVALPSAKTRCLAGNLCYESVFCGLPGRNKVIDARQYGMLDVFRPWFFLLRRLPV